MQMYKWTRGLLGAAIISGGTLGAGLTGCAGSLDHPERFVGDAGGGGGNDAASTCPDVVKTQFVAVCATSSCHSAVSKAGNLDLETTDIAGRLRGKMAAGGSGLLIDAANPDKSVLYTKVTAIPPFAARMPFAAPPLDDKTINCIRLWVEQAAATAPVDGGTGG